MHHKLAELLLSLKPCIILVRNSNQETALHKASAAGCLQVVELLLNCKSNEVRCNSSECAHPEGYDLEGCRLDLIDHWRATNVDNETALHYAARGNYVEIVSLLLEKVQGIELILNKAGQSALYTACQSGSWGALQILGEMDSISDTRQDTHTCLHQLLDIGGRNWSDMVLYLLRKRPALAEKADAADNLPLHLVSVRGDQKIAEELLRICPDTALQKNKDGMAAIHYAARMGRKDIVRCLIDNVPDCTEVLGKDHKNALHFALEYGRIQVAKTLLFESMDPSLLINQADKDVQTAFHKAAANSELASEMLSPMLEISRWNVNAADNRGRLLERSGPLLEGSPKMDSEDKVEGNMSVIATLIFTVSFAAAITVPGGVRSDNGVPVRMHATALQCFTICNTLAFCFSIIAMFMFTIKSREKQEVSLRIHSFILFRAIYYRGILSFEVCNISCGYNGSYMVYNAINATIVSFITGVYVTVAPKCLWLALTVCTTGLFTLFYIFLHGDYRPKEHSILWLSC